MHRYLSILIVVIGAGVARADDWPQWLGPKRDSVWRETGILDKFPENGPKVVWREKIAGGYAGPAVANGRCFVMDYVVEKGDAKPNPQKRNQLQGKERVLCFDAAKGKLLWEQKYDCPYEISYPAGPRCTPTVDGDHVYTLGAEGNLNCFDAAKGTVIWSKNLKTDYKTTAPMWGFAGHPLVDGDKLFCLVGGEGSVAVAFDKKTGKELWRALTATEPGYCPPTMIEHDGKKQLLIWHAESLNALDPDTGKPYWSVPLEPSYGMSIATPRKLGDLVYAGGIGDKAVLLKLTKDKPEIVWRGKKGTAIYSVNVTPFLEDGHMYGVTDIGDFLGVKLETGERLWETAAPTTGKKRAPSATAFIVKNGDRFFLMSETGELIIAKLSPKGYEELSRAKLLDPTGTGFGRDVVWSHPAFADKCVFARNDKEIVCVSLGK